MPEKTDSREPVSDAMDRAVEAARAQIRPGARDDAENAVRAAKPLLVAEVEAKLREERENHGQTHEYFAQEERRAEQAEAQLAKARALLGKALAFVPPAPREIETDGLRDRILAVLDCPDNHPASRESEEE